MTRISERGAQAASRSLEQIADSLDGSERIFDGLLDELFDLQREWWNSLGRGTWAPDKPQTLLEDRRTGQDTQLMRDRGDLHAAATRRGANGQEISTSREQLIFTVTVPYAEPLARGGRGAVVDPSDRDAERFADAFVNELLDG